MRIARLLLARYGHLSDLDLVFPAENGLHVVLGPNEAGKSTVLAAIGDCLFGFQHRTDFAFLHEPRDLLVALTLRAADGRTGTFRRRKKRNEDLCDEQERPVPESAIAAFLSGATRERFERVFGLDAAELRRGGEAILRGEGEVGESILQAHTGIHGFRDLLERLDSDAKRLFGDRRGPRALHQAGDAFKAAKADLDTRTIEPSAYKEAREAQGRLLAARTALGAEDESLRAERDRLERIRSTAPARKALARALPERAAMGAIAALPADADAQRVAAVTARERSADALRRERERDDEVGAALAALIINASLLAEGELIDRLAAEQSRVEAAQRDRETQRLHAEQHRRDVEDSGRRMGQAFGVDALAARVPDAMTRDAADRAITTHVTLAERQAKAHEELEVAERERAEAILTLASTPEPEPFAALRDALDRAKSEGPIDAEWAKAAATLTTARRELRDALATLPLWSGSADELATAPMPLEAVVDQHATVLDKSEAALRSCREEVARLDKALESTEANIEAMAGPGDLPTTDAITKLRDTRNRAWHLLRRHRLSGGTPPTDDEMAGLGSADRLVDTFESLLRDADALADRRTDNSARVATFEQLGVTQAENRLLRINAAAAAATAETAHAAESARWKSLWQPAGIVPLDPAAMREWRRSRDDVLDRRRRAQEATDKAADAEGRHAGAWARLAELLPTEAAEAKGRLAEIKRAAERVHAERESQQKARNDARKEVERAGKDVERRRTTLARAETALVTWRSGWEIAAAAMGLRPEASAEDGKLALDLWNEVKNRLGDWRAASDRVAEMTLLIDGFRDEAAALAYRVAPDLADAEMHDAVRALITRLTASRANAASQDDLIRQREILRSKMESLTREHDEAESTLASLRVLADAGDDAALEAAIARAAEHAALSQQISGRLDELRPLDKGMSLAELEQEAAGVDPHGLEPRLGQIDERRKDISEEKVAIAGQLATLGASLKEMQTGRDAAGAAQAMQDAVAEADDIAARYVRLRMAHTLLAAGLERFRREQQGPLLARAGQLFARLTEDRYNRLCADETDDGKMVMKALRPDGSACPADRLSDGTRDQLYLALRLAAIESHADRTEPLPFIADDLLVNFSDSRAHAAIRVLAEFGAHTQTILFTHHAHIAEMAEPHLASSHYFPGS